MKRDFVVDCEIRVVHADARRPDYLEETAEPVRQAVYAHADFAVGVQRWDVQAALASMDRCGIQFGILSGLAWQDPAILGENNEYVRECIVQHADRFRGLYIADASAPEKAADAIMALDERCYVGVELIPKWQRANINEPRLEPIFEAVRRRGFFMKVYTAHPTQTLEGDAPYRTLRFLQEHPDIRTLIPHLGGLLCLYALYPPIRDAIRNAWFITSVSATMKMVRFAAEVNPDNLLFGTDFPFNHSFDQKQPLEEMRQLGLSDDATRKILGGTASRIFKLEGAADPKLIHRDV